MGVQLDQIIDDVSRDKIGTVANEQLDNLMTILNNNLKKPIEVSISGDVITISSPLKVLYKSDGSDSTQNSFVQSKTFFQNSFLNFSVSTLNLTDGSTSGSFINNPMTGQSNTANYWTNMAIELRSDGKYYVVFGTENAIPGAQGDPAITDGAKLICIVTLQNNGSAGTWNYNTPTEDDFLIFDVQERQNTIKLINGSVGSPSLSFLNDTDTGFYGDGSNSVYLSQGGSNNITFDAGIGLVFNTGYRCVQFTSLSGVDVGVPTSGNVKIYSKDNEIYRRNITNVAKLLTDQDGTIQQSDGSVTDNAFARYDGTTGKLIQNSLASLSDIGEISVGGGSSVVHTYQGKQILLKNDTATYLHFQTSAGSERGVIGHSVDSSNNFYVTNNLSGSMIFNNNGDTIASCTNLGRWTFGFSGASGGGSYSHEFYASIITLRDRNEDNSSLATDFLLDFEDSTGSRVGYFGYSNGTLVLRNELLNKSFLIQGTDTNGTTTIGQTTGSGNWQFGYTASGGGSLVQTCYGDYLNLRNSDTSITAPNATIYLRFAAYNNVRQGYIGFNGTANLDIYQDSASSIRFYTNGANLRGSISSTGLWTIGSSGSNNDHVWNGRILMTTNEAVNSTNAIDISKSATGTSGNVYMTFKYNTSTINGYIQNNSSTTITFAAASDRRIKENIVDLSESLEKLCKMRPVHFKMKGTDEEQDGFIAQELQTVFPHLVTSSDNGLGDDLPEGVKPWVISSGEMNGLYPHIIKAIQELKAKNDALETRIATLEI